MSSPVAAGTHALMPGRTSTARREQRRQRRRERRTTRLLIVASAVALASLLLTAVLVLEHDGSSHGIGTSGTSGPSTAGLAR
jgi:hypothetical protein